MYLLELKDLMVTMALENLNIYLLYFPRRSGREKSCSTWFFRVKG